MPKSNPILLGDWEVVFEKDYPILAYISYDCSKISSSIYDYAGIVIVSEVKPIIYESSGFEMNLTNLYYDSKIYRSTPLTPFFTREYIHFINLKTHIPHPKPTYNMKNVFYPYFVFHQMCDIKPEAKRCDIDTYTNPESKYGYLWKKGGSNPYAVANVTLDISRGLYKLSDMFAFAEKSANYICTVRFDDEDFNCEDILRELPNNAMFTAKLGYAFNNAEIDFIEHYDDAYFVNMKMGNNETPIFAMDPDSTNRRAEVFYIESNVVQQFRKTALNDFIMKNYGDTRGIKLGHENREYYRRQPNTMSSYEYLTPKFTLETNALAISRKKELFAQYPQHNYYCHSGIKFSHSFTIDYDESLHNIEFDISDQAPKGVSYIDPMHIGTLCRLIDRLSWEIETDYGR